VLPLKQTKHSEKNCKLPETIFTRYSLNHFLMNVLSWFVL
jgi:hypothetical protein